MKKFIIFLVLITFLKLPAKANYNIDISCEQTVGKSWEQVIKNIKKQIPQELIKQNLTDPNYKENKIAIKYKISQLGERYITHHQDGDYTINYSNNPSFGYCYDSNGNLIRVLNYVKTNTFQFTYYYSTNNMLTEINYEPHPNETYVFDAVTGKIKYYGINNRCYYPNNLTKP